MVLMAITTLYACAAKPLKAPCGELDPSSIAIGYGASDDLCGELKPLNQG